jgi:hypothetical protein
MLAISFLLRSKAWRVDHKETFATVARPRQFLFVR